MATSTTNPLALDAELYRPDFPILRSTTAAGVDIAYLDNAASTQRPTAVIDAMAECYRDYYANVHRGIHTLSELSTERYERARRTVADFLNAETMREVIFTAGTTAAINTVARSWGDANVGPGDSILLTMAEHHANIVPWHQLAERTGAEVHFAPLTEDGRLDLHAVDNLLETLRPKMFAFTALSNVLGTINPVDALVAAAHRHGALALVDAAQAAPHSVMDVRQWDADFVVFSGHKICGPNAIGVLYGKEPILEAMPPFLGGGAMIRRVTTTGFEPAALPEKFEAGTPPIAEAIGLEAAVNYVREIGLERITAYEQQLVTQAELGLRQIPGLRILGPSPEHKGGITSFVIDGIHSHDIAQWLDKRGVAIRAGHHCAMPLHRSLGATASSRASFYFYNTPAEVDTMVAAVAESRERFAKKGRKRTPQIETMPRFIHAADIHLDSPLQKLESYEGAPVDEIRGATRRALQRLVDLAIEEHVDFLLIAGDLYDGDWRDHQTGLFFVGQAARLVAHGIPLYVIRGNHDAENVMTQSLPLPKNPDGSSILLSADRPETVRMESIGVSIHGQSFGARAEMENLAVQYPRPDGGMFNLGLLHTSLTGAEGHDPYAPCTPGMLADKGYDYWALGHIHTRGEHHLAGAAPIVFCGNLQGRHSRETGPKGCVLVDIDTDGTVNRSFRSLEVVRWEVCHLDAANFDHVDDCLDHFADWVDSMLEECGEASLVARLRIAGMTPLHDDLFHRTTHYESAARAHALERGLGRVWVESLRLRTSPPMLDRDAMMDGPIASVLNVLAQYESGNIQDPRLLDTLAAMERKIPEEVFRVDMPDLLRDARSALLGRLRGGPVG